jgi:acyl dehydratase
VTARGRFFDEWEVGDVEVTPARTITETDVVQFAQLSGDFNPIHTDAVFAAASPFGERLAHGLLGLSVLTGLVARTGLFDGSAIALLGIEEWRFAQPVRLGDTVHARLEVVGKRLLSDGVRGVLDRRFDLLLDDGSVAQSGRMPVLLHVHRKP